MSTLINIPATGPRNAAEARAAGFVDDTSASGGGSFKVTNINAGQVRSELSRQWASRPHDQRFTSLDDLLAFRRDQQDRSREARMLPGQIKATTPEIRTKADMEQLTFEVDGAELSATHWAFGQIASRAKAPAAYLRTLPTPIVADALNWGLRYAGNDEGVKLLYSELGNDVNRLDAVTGPDYGRVFDTEVIAALQRVAGNGRDRRWRIPGVMDWRTMEYDPFAPVTKDSTTLYASDRDLFLFLVDDLNPIEVGKARDGQPDLLFRGMYARNSMVGASSLVLGTFYLRGLCLNRLMWGVEQFEEISIRHTRLAPERFVTQAEPALLSFANGATQRLIDGVQKAKEAKVASDDDEMLDFLRKRSMSQKTAKAVMEAVEKEEGVKARTIWDVAQGITAVARNIPNNDTRVEMEMEARKLLDKVA